MIEFETPGGPDLMGGTQWVEGRTRASMTDRELLVMCFERILSDRRQIDSEWGAISDGGLEGAIERGEETLIPLLRKQLGGEK